MAITASMVKELRDATSVGMMDCKKALDESNGDFDAAVIILRERGAAVAAKRAGKEAKEGKIDAIVSADAQSAAMIEVNCETDFVTRNEDFQTFAAELRDDALNHETGAMAEANAQKITDKISSIGEKIQLRRNEKWTVEGTGAITSYIHYERARARFENLSSVSDTAGDDAAGRNYFDQNCVSCHLGDKGLAGIGDKIEGVDLRKQVLWPEIFRAAQSFNLDQLQNADFQDGRKKHQLLLENYVEQNVDDLLAYLRSAQ